MRYAAPFVLFGALLLAGCGGGGGASPTTTERPAAPGTLEELLGRPGPEVALIPGAADFAPGEIRYTFLVIRNDGKSVERPAAEVWVGRALDGKPLVKTKAVLDDVGVPGVSEKAIGDVTKIYVATFRLPAAGKYFLVTQPDGADIQGVRDFVVAERTKAPDVGDEAVASRTPTVESTGGDFESLTTSDPPDVELLQISIADALKRNLPFVVTFATPKYCTSRTCGPTVDVVDTVRKRVAGTPVRFIHVEVFEGNDPSRGVNRWMREWKLPSEPFTFVVGRDGRVKARFEGAVSVRELESAVRAHLL